MDNLNDNKNKWEELKEEFKKRMETHKNYIPESRGIIVEISSKLPSINIGHALSKFNSLEETDVNLLGSNRKALVS